jgi:hypothetical protein
VVLQEERREAVSTRLTPEAMADAYYRRVRASGKYFIVVDEIKYRMNSKSPDTIAFWKDVYDLFQHKIYNHE